MEITVTDIPKSIKSFAFSPKTVLSERTTVEYLIRMKEYIFGSKCCDAADEIGIDVYDLVFIGEKAFMECCEPYLTRIRDKDKEIIKTALLLKKMYVGEYIRISLLKCSNDKAYVREPEKAYLVLLNEDIKALKRKKNEESAEKKDIGLNKHAKIILESVRLAAVKFGMMKALQIKELIDKYNYRRFSSSLKLNNRPASVEDVTSTLSLNRVINIVDFSNSKTRINFSALFSIAYGGFRITDLYSKNTVFEITSFDKEKKLSELASDFINIINNGNGIEIANMLIHIITVYSAIELPPVNMNDLGEVMDNYSIYYATATLASVCEKIFKFDGMNGELRKYLKKHTLENYWNVNDRLMLMKQYSIIVSFCYDLAHFDPEAYREDPEYQGSILYRFENAERFAKELKRNA